MTRADKSIFVMMAVVALVWFAATSFWAELAAGEQSDILIIVGEEEVARLPLGVEDHLIEVDGDIGRTVVEIEGERARVASSPCDRHICEHHGWISRPGESAICAPNRVVVTVVSDEEPAFDALLR